MDRNETRLTSDAANVATHYDLRSAWLAKAAEWFCALLSCLLG